MLRSDAMAISGWFEDWKKSWSKDTRIEKRTLQMEYSCYWGVCSFKIALDKKREFAENNDSLRRIILMGRAANIHIIMALQRPEHLY